MHAWTFVLYRWTLPLCVLGRKGLGRQGMRGCCWSPSARGLKTLLTQHFAAWSCLVGERMGSLGSSVRGTSRHRSPTTRGCRVQVMQDPTSVPSSTAWNFYMQCCFCCRYQRVPYSGHHRKLHGETAQPGPELTPAARNLHCNSCWHHQSPWKRRVSPSFTVQRLAD